MIWKPIRLPAIPKASSKIVVATLATLKKSVDDLSVDRTNYDSDLAAVKQVPPDKIGPTLIDNRNELMGRAIALLQREVAIRKNVIEFMTGPLVEEHFRLFDEANKEAIEIEANLRKDLVKIGYVDMDQNAARVGGIHGAIQPGWISCHSKVHGARERMKELQHFPNAKVGMIEEFENAIAEAEQRLEQFKISSLNSL